MRLASRREASSSSAQGVGGLGIESRSRYGVDCKLFHWESEAACRHWPIGQQTLFADLSEAQFERVLVTSSRAVVPVDARIYEEEVSASAVYIVGQGLLKLIKSASAGPRIVRLLGPCAAAGLEALSGERYRHTAVALRPTELFRIPLDVLQGLQRHHAGFAERVLAQWEQQLESADRWLADLAQGTVPERLQRLVAILADTEEGHSAWVQLPPTTDLASILGSSRESVSRALSGLERTRILRRVAKRTYAFEQGRRPF